MPSKRRSRRRKTVWKSVHMQVPCPDALPPTAETLQNTHVTQLLPLNTLTDLRLGSNNISRSCKPPGLKHSFHKMILYICNLETYTRKMAKPPVIHHLLSSTKPSLIVSPNPPLHTPSPCFTVEGISFLDLLYPELPLLFLFSQPSYLTAPPCPVPNPPTSCRPPPINNQRLFIWHLVSIQVEHNWLQCVKTHLNHTFFFHFCANEASK